MLIHEQRALACVPVRNYITSDPKVGIQFLAMLLADISRCLTSVRLVQLLCALQRHRLG